MNDKVKLLRPFTRWSYSAWSAYKTCPYMFGKGYYEGQRGPQGPAAARGEAVHKLSEELLKGGILGIPKPLKKLDTQYNSLLKLKSRLVVEQFWGVTPKWKPSNNPDTSWCVMKMDVAITPTKKDKSLAIIDLKTGREYPGHENQGSLYATIGHALFPAIKEVHVEFWYADSGESASWTYKLPHLRDMRYEWDTEGKKIMSARKFPKTPSEHGCRWCHLRSSVGGSCIAWKQVL